MKKLILILVASFFMVQLADAQMFSFGLKGGIGFSTVKIEDITGIQDGGDVYKLITGDAVMGYHVGVQTRIKIAMFYVQPELYWNAGGGTIEKVAQGGASELLDVKFNRIDIPVLVGMKLGPVRLNLGPVVSFVISETNDFSVPDTDYNVYMDNLTWCWQAGIGVGLGKFSLDVRYEGPLSDLSEILPDDLDQYTMDPRPQQWILSLGYWFGE
jgi:hypothetical protein